MGNLFAAGTANYTKKTGEHRHSTWEVVYYLDTAGVLKAGTQEYEFESGHVVILPPGQPHFEHSYRQMNCIYIWIRSLPFLEEQVCFFKDNSDHDVLNIVKMIYMQYQLKPKNWSNIADGLIHVLEQFVLSANSPGSRNKLVENAEHEITVNMSNKEFDLEKLYKAYPVSPNHFRTLFREDTGMTPLEYLTDLRVTNAKQLLDMTLLPIKSIADSVGFSDPYYFSRVFKKHTGFYPTDWRNRPAEPSDRTAGG